MKKLRFSLPLLAIILATGSAFTTKLTDDTEYFTTDGQHFEVKGSGICSSGSLYCTYTANVQDPDLDNPDDFTPQGDDMTLWIQP